MANTILPRFSIMMTHQTAAGVAIMKFGKTLFARFGLFTRKDAELDQFDLRLLRIGSRERRHQVRPVLFKNLHSPLAA